VVAPLLYQKGVPAAFFVNSRFIDNTELFYRFKAALLLERLKTTSVQARREAHRLIGTCDDSVEDLTQFLLRAQHRDGMMLNGMAAVLGVNFEDYLQRVRPFMNGEQVKRLLRQGFDVGGHSLDHPSFAGLPLEEQVRQTREDVDALTTRFGLPHRFFAFPFGAVAVSQTFYAATSLDLAFGTGGWFHSAPERLVNRVAMESHPPGDLRHLNRSLCVATLR
jgi:peptidoglycan/xylan/chitin deacetylase (PgdA/CDA1 family)